MMRCSTCHLFILLGLSVFPLSVSAKIVERIEAVVNDEVISTGDVEHAQTEYRNSLNSEIKPNSENHHLREIVLNRLIDDELILQEIKRLNLQVTEAQLNSQIDSIKAANGITSDDGLRQALAKEGLSYDQWRTQLKRRMELGNFLSLKRNTIRVQEEDLRAYYEGNKNQFMEKPTRHIYTIVLTTASKRSKEGSKAAKTASDLLNQIKKGASFQALARQYSKGSTAESGGDIGFVEKGDLMPELDKVIFSTLSGHTAVAETEKGIYLIQVAEVRPAKLKPFENVQEEIRQILTEQEAQKYLASTLKNMREKAFVDVKTQ